MREDLGRRRFLKETSLLGLGLVAGGCGRALLGGNSKTDQRPNFLFVLTDDQASNTMSCSGHPFLQTPNMDRLAREGVIFRNAFVTTSLCSPSRACNLTGLHAHTHGVVTNEMNSDPYPDIKTYPQILQKAGYETAFIGKWHMATPKDTSPRPGFDHWVVLPGQGSYVNPKINVDGKDIKQEGYVTDILTYYAIQWLNKKRTAPFSLCLWHKAAHGPFTPPEKYTDAFPGAELPEPKNYRDDFSDKPEWFRRHKLRAFVKKREPIDLSAPVSPTFEPKPWEPKAKGNIDYCRTLMGIDDSLGKVLETLERTGQLENTVIIFAGDNGFLLGAHSMTDKRVMFEESIKIPLIMRFPKRFGTGKESQGMALNIDMAPTILELAGVPVPNTIQGKSLLPVLEGSAERIRDSFLYTYFRESFCSTLPLIHGVRTDDWKYVSYPDIRDIDELYDLKSDPYELHNLSQRPEFAERRQKMIQELNRLLEETKYPRDKQLGKPAPA